MAVGALGVRLVRVVRLPVAFPGIRIALGGAADVASLFPHSCRGRGPGLLSGRHALVGRQPLGLLGTAVVGTVAHEILLVAPNPNQRRGQGSGSPGTK